MPSDPAFTSIGDLNPADLSHMIEICNTAVKVVQCYEEKEYVHMATFVKVLKDKVQAYDEFCKTEKYKDEGTN